MPRRQTVLLSGEQTDGRFAMLDMLIPPGRLEAGDSANIPANGSHAFRNTADAPARLLCTVAPAGLESFFAEFRRPSSDPGLAGARAQ